jgi:aspartate racemase
MKRIGLIGGMSWESTLVYYRLLNEGVRARRGALHSADILLHSLDFESVVGLQKAGRWDAAGALLGSAGAGLVRAGADCVLICTNTMHLVSEAVERAAGVPLIDIIAETGRSIVAAGCRRPLLLATRYTMEHGFYAERMRRSAEIDVIVPAAEDRALVHGVIFDELCRGEVRDESRTRVLEVIARGVASGADSVILGCTEICLLLDPDRLAVPGFDSTRIHARAALDFALQADDTDLRRVA